MHFSSDLWIVSLKYFCDKLSSKFRIDWKNSIKYGPAVDNSFKLLLFLLVHYIFHFLKVPLFSFQICSRLCNVSIPQRTHEHLLQHKNYFSSAWCIYSANSFAYPTLLACFYFFPENSSRREYVLRCSFPRKSSGKCREHFIY